VTFVIKYHQNITYFQILNPDLFEIMETDINKQDKILSTLGIKQFMGVQPSSVIYSISNFKYYVTSEYKESQRKETDEVYRMSEFNLLHIDSGLRLTLTATESYDGETEEYKVFRMFIITSLGKELEVMDADFKNEIFYTTDLEIPFSETHKLIEFEDKDYMAPHFTKEEEEETEIVENGKNSIKPKQKGTYILAPHFTKEELDEMRTDGMARAIIELQLGMRKPKNKGEEELLKQIKEAEAKGWTIHLPLD